MIVFHNIVFNKSATNLAQCPPDNGKEIAFVGRSNVGKSSVINVVTGKSIARTSRTPGRTQLLNFFNFTEKLRLVDLPGYGYAKVTKQQRAQWEIMLTEYFQQRKSLQGIIIIMDIRHALTELDKNMLAFANMAKHPVHILLNKADKLSRNQQLQQMRQSMRTLQEIYPDAISVQLFSALKKQGIEELRQKILLWFAN